MHSIDQCMRPGLVMGEVVMIHLFIKLLKKYLCNCRFVGSC